MILERWRIWEKYPEEEGTLVDRARGKLPEMESTKQLVRLVSEIYKPGMTVLDVGCNAGHYLRGLRRIDLQLSYSGVDACATYIDQAKEIFVDDPYTRFEVRDVFNPLFPDDPFDIVFCCNVLQHLPDFRPPVRNMLDSTKKTCIVRMLLGEYTTIVCRAVGQELDDEGMPVNFIYQNTWEKALFVKFVENLGWKVEFVEDEFDPAGLQKEYVSVKKKYGTQVVSGKQVDGNIILNWVWAKIMRPQAGQP